MSKYEATCKYHYLLETILNDGFEKDDRTGTGRISHYGLSYQVDVSHYFPLITTKKVLHEHVLTELCWFFRGESNIEYMQERNCKIWDAWATPYNSVGPVYGVQWFSWLKYDNEDDDDIVIDQMSTALETLKTNPESSRIIVSAWNVGELQDMQLPPCHLLFQLLPSPGLHPDDKWRLSLRMYQRSADMFLGVPFNIASYAALLHTFAFKAGMTPYMLYMDFGDAHIYLNHVAQVQEQLCRDPEKYPSPRISLVDMTRDQAWCTINPENYMIHDYLHYPFIKGDISV